MMKTTPIIRKPKPEEAEELTKLSFRSKAYWDYPDEWLKAWTTELTVTTEMIENWIAYLIEVDKRIVGFWAREPIESEKTSRGLLFIAPEVIGKGYGKLLSEAVLQEAKKRGLRFFTIEADPNAIPFYIKIGGKKIGEQPSLVIPGRMCPIIRFDLENLKR